MLNVQGQIQKIIFFWGGGGHIGLQSPKTTKRDAKVVEGKLSGQGVYPVPMQTTGRLEGAP